MVLNFLPARGLVERVHKTKLLHKQEGFTWGAGRIFEVERRNDTRHPSLLCARQEHQCHDYKLPSSRIKSKQQNTNGLKNQSLYDDVLNL